MARSYVSISVGFNESRAIETLLRVHIARLDENINRNKMKMSIDRVKTSCEI